MKKLKFLFILSVIVFSLFASANASFGTVYFAINAGADGGNATLQGGFAYDSNGTTKLDSTDSSGNTGTTGCLVQYIRDSGNNGIQAPDPTKPDYVANGDTLITTKYVGNDSVWNTFTNTDGIFYHGVSGNYSGTDINTSKIYIRIWNNKTIAESQFYNDSQLLTPSTSTNVPPIPNDVGIGNITANKTKPVPQPGTLQFSAATYSVNEGTATATITVTRTGGSSGAASVNYATSNGTATAGSDYTAASGTLNWADGNSTNKTFTVAITNDTAVENNETINLTLSNAAGASLGTQKTAVLTIVDNDVPAVTLTSINITPINTTINVGSTQQYTALGSYSNGSTQTITNSVTWNSSKPGVASISNTGLATALSGGDSTNISAALSGKTSNIAVLTVNTPLPTDPAITSITWQAGENKDYVYGTIEINGSNFGAAPGSVTIGGVTVPTTGAGIKIYQWTPTKITCGVPEAVTAGANTVTVTTADGSASSSITVKARIYSLDPTSAKAGEQITISGSGFGTNAGNVSVTFNGTPGTQITANNTTITVTVPSVAAGEVALIVSVNGQTATTTFTVTGTPTNPTIVSLSTAGSLEVGQTVIISGTNFGKDKADTSMVRFGTTAANPTAWSDTSITVAVPQGAGTGEVDLTVVTANGEASQPITIAGKVIYLDDFEGGSVGAWAANLAQSGYYTVGSNISPNNSEISANGPQAEAKFEGAKGMKIKYSHVADNPADLWGAKMSNTLDLSAAKSITMYINWDDSANAFDFVVQDSTGKTAKASVSNTSLMNLNGGGYGKLTIPVANFTIDNLGFDWSKITNYNVMYTTGASSETYHYVDNIIAVVQDDTVTTDVKITSIDPASAPAGTKVKIKGEEFGFAQGQSALLFENTDTKAAFVAKVEKWGNGEIQAVVPELAGVGTYDVRVIKIAISAGTLNAQESNNEIFKITANAAAVGTVNIYPNPFNPNAETVNFAYNPGSAANVGIYIYDMTAKQIYKQVDSGSTATWNGKDDWGKMSGDGAYLLRVVNEDNKQLIAKGKILVIKQ